MNNPFIFNRNTMEFRYFSGTTVYSEQLVNGRLLFRDINATGMPPHRRDTVEDMPVSAFELVIDGQDATYGWSFENWSTGKSIDGRPWAELVLRNDRLSVLMELKTLAGEDGFYSRHISIQNLSQKKLSITSLSPLSGTLWELKLDVKDSLGDYDQPAFRVGSMQDNHWGNEGNFAWREIPYNAAISFGSETGKSGHSHPFAIVQNLISGGYFICQMEWGANWNFRFFNDFRYTAGYTHTLPYLRLKFALSPVGMAPMRVLDPMEQAETPRIHFGFCYTDFDCAIQRLHAYQRAHLLAKPINGYDLIGYDHWGYREHNLDEAYLLGEVERAAQIGAEVFVVDAGWYGKPGTDWFKTVGDWSSSRLENDLYPVIRRARELGLKFGLWIEPEAVGAESELAATHPDWVIHRYGQAIPRCLDLSRPEVEAFLEAQLTGVIERYQLDLLRLDYNNEYPCEGGFSANGEYLENTHWRHVEAIHRIFDHIREKYPALMLENCASGGGRTDLGMMTRFSKTQFSDWYKFPRIARTFNGMSMCLPPEKLMFLYGSVQSASRFGCAEAQLQMSIQGIPQISGIAYDAEEVNPFYLDLLKQYITLYKEFIRPIQNQIRIYHHTPVISGFSGKGWAVTEAMLPDGTKGYANINRLPGCEEDTWLMKFRGLDATKHYRITCLTGNKQIYASGYELTVTGLPVRIDSALTSQMLLIEAI